MSAARHQKAFGAMSEWWAVAARALALVLALAVALPGSGLAEDLAYHRFHPEVTSSAALDAAPASREADPGLAAHVHCGCHIAAALHGEAPDLPAPRPRPRFERVVESRPSIVPDRLPRPPRA